MLLRELLDALETIAPTRHAESWDNVGLIAGDPQQPVTKVDARDRLHARGRLRAAGEGCDAVDRLPPADLRPR
jgi:hypothetical protein